MTAFRDKRYPFSSSMGRLARSDAVSGTGSVLLHFNNLDVSVIMTTDVLTNLVLYPPFFPATLSNRF